MASELERLIAGNERRQRAFPMARKRTVVFACGTPWTTTEDRLPRSVRRML